MSLHQKLPASPTKDWLLQRITAVLLVPLTIPLLMFLKLCLNAPYAETMAWLKSPWHTLALELWLLLTCYHAVLGLRVVIEDYVADEATQLLLIKAINLIFSFAAVAALYFIFRIY